MRTGRLIATLATAAAAALLAAAPGAQAGLQFDSFKAEYHDQAGAAVTQAGSHPFALTTSLTVENTETGPAFWELSGAPKDLIVDQIEGLAGNATAVPQCSTLDFLARECADSAVVGITAVAALTPTSWWVRPVENLVPPPGVPARLGFEVENVFVTIDVGLEQAPPHNLVASLFNISNAVKFFGSVFQVWGIPAAESHDKLRGPCGNNLLEGLSVEEVEFVPGASDCPSDAPEVPLLTLPRSCEGPQSTLFETDSWEEPGAWITGGDTHPALTGCGKLGFQPEISSRPSADSAESASGLDFSISFDDEGLLSPDPEALAFSEIEKALVRLPEGITVNPSIAEGLGVCTLADLGRETLAAAPGEGCPNASKIGTVAVRTPLVDRAVEGSVFLAEQDDPATAAKENPFDSLIAFYIVLKSPELGILVKQPAKVEPDPRTGQLVTTVTDIPQVPFSRFDFHFREGQRAPLITPGACGAFTVEAELTPRANPTRPVTETSQFQITRGVGGGACPPAGTPPFEPGFQAGSENNDGGAYSPFLMRLTRRDGDQDLTRFAAQLPPGLSGRLAGVDMCPQTQIDLARAKSGRAELASPSCPLNSRIGQSTAGAGVGSTLTYVPGSLYLAGPYNGAPLSVVAVTPAVAGPFDAGTVVVRVALRVNPRSGEVEVDGAASDPIPHILKGIVLKVRDLRIDVDRSGFTLNPTSCDPAATAAEIFGSGPDVFNPADDVAFTASARYQAAGCLALPYKPRLEMRLRGGTRRGANPALRTVFRPRPGDANSEKVVVRLPRSAFLDQAHIRTICTRVQFAADSCPKAARYGFVRAWTPLLDEPLRGPVYLRSSNNELPDLVFDLRGLVDIEAVARIDSIRGGIRATFTKVPDAPLSRVVLRMQGGRKGLIVNSRNICTGKNRVAARLDAHNGRRILRRPLLRASCAKRKARRSSHRRG